MKKILFLTLMLIMHVSAFSQVEKETVYLKDGNVVKGSVVGFVPNQSITIAADGDTFVYNLPDIDKIVKNQTFVAGHDASESVYTIHERGYKFIMSMDFMVGKMSGLKWTTIHGVQLNNKSYLGLGVGVIIADDYDFHMSIPVFADFRFDFIEDRITPYVEARAGYDVDLDGFSGFYGDLALGCRLRRFSVSAGVETLRGEDVEYGSHFVRKGDFYVYDDNHYEYQALNFVIRFSVEF